MAETKNSRILCTIPLLFVVIILCPVVQGKVIYVDNDATGANNGISWENAYVFLQDALADANESDKPVEIRVSNGIYKPDQGAGITVGDREATFQLINGGSIKGGFAGLGAADPNARDTEAYETILSGDLAGNDIHVNNLSKLFIEPTRSENSYNVVTGSGTDDTAVLDGFTITAGNADYEYFNDKPQSNGGGLYNFQGKPVITNCTFLRNAGFNGGGMYNNNSHPTIINCCFNANVAEYYRPTDVVFGGSGGGIFNIHSSPTLTNCTFTGNYSGNGGAISNFDSSNPNLNNCIFIGNSAAIGGVYNNSSNPKLLNCTFSKNSASIGGGMSNDFKSNPNLTNCMFSENWAGYRGGGMQNHWYSDPNITNCTFTKNRSEYGGGIYNGSRTNPILTKCTFNGNSAVYGGGMFNFMSNPTLTNCILSGNSANIYGGGIHNTTSRLTLANCTFSDNSAGVKAGGLYNYSYSNPILMNCILWSNTMPVGPEMHSDRSSLTTVKYSDIQGGWTGEGNIDADPLFAEPGYWANVNEPNIVVEPNDPNAVWVDGDYHLKSQSGRWNLNSQSWVIDEVTSPCIDAGDPNTPVGDEPQPNGGRINMGAYGGTVEASKSVFNPVFETSQYTFLSDQSTVVQTGGIAGVHRTYVIEGQFQLSIDPNAGIATFVHVDANAMDDSPYRRTLDPNEVFNMTELVGTVIGDTIIVFTGKVTNGSDILIIAILNNDLVNLVGQTFPPVGSADFFIFNMNAVAQRKYGGGTGEPNNPYLIYTAEQMNAIGAEPNDWDKHFKLMADIDLSSYIGTAFNIIGYWRNRSDNKPFTGLFDGNSKKISNFNYTSIDASKVGLFGYLYGENARIKDLGLHNPNVNAGTGRYVGALVSDTNGYITGCYVEGGSVSGNHIVGGLTGYNRGTMSNCTFASKVSGTGWVVGGLAGGNSGIITDCCSTSDISAEGYVGGMVGTNDGTIADCYATGNMWGNNGVGGLVGHNDYYANIARCYSTGGVSGDSALGGLVGSNSGRITDCYSAGSVSGDEWVGGLVGINGSYFFEAFGTITNCYSVGSVSSHTTVGGLLGFNYGTVTASFWDIETSGRSNMCGRQMWGTGCNNADGKMTAEMQMESMFTDAGWDFVGESVNGTEDIWWIEEGKDYPRLWWELIEILIPKP